MTGDVHRGETATRIELTPLEEIEAWNEGFRLGSRPHPLTDADRVAGKAVRNLTGYGPLTPLLGKETRGVEVSLAKPIWCRG